MKFIDEKEKTLIWGLECSPTKVFCTIVKKNINSLKVLAD